MVVDTSAIVAILSNEPERRAFIEAIVAAPVRLISAATLLEAGIVVEARRGESAGRGCWTCYFIAHDSRLWQSMPSRWRSHAQRFGAMEKAATRRG